MSKFSHINSLAWLAVLAAALFLSACAATTHDSGREEAEAEVVYEIEPWDGHGLEIPLDGSSIETWEASMARVKAHTTENEYNTLDNAIRYLLVYDLQSHGDMNKLIERLDGLTGYEILSKVKWRKAAPGKGPAEKGAADAKIIDA